MRTDPVTGTKTPPVNATLIHLHIGIDAQADQALHVTHRRSTKPLILQALTTIGTEVGGMDTPISIDPNSNLAWRPRFDAKTLLFEERMLQAACYIVCAYLTGMRDAEVQAMRAGCVEARRSEDGVIERYRIKSTTYKRRETRGQPETWTTIEPVANAIGVLERLTEHIRRRRGGDTLWRVLNDSQSTKDHISAEIVRQLNVFRDHLNAQFGTPEVPVVPPGPDGKPWRITTRQFRRTVAWHIANRPFGAVAGMIQYKHASVAAYEGYAGSSRSGFRNEVERERALGQLDDVLSYFERHRVGEVLSGPAAARISGELQQATEKLGPLPGHIADPTRVRAMLAHVAKTLFVGVLNDCFFDPATALCLKGKTEAAMPAMAQCRPDRCPNSCIASHHRPLWAKAITDGEDLLKTKRLSPLQREAIENDVKRYRRVLGSTRQTPRSDATAQRLFLFHPQFSCPSPTAACAWREQRSRILRPRPNQTIDCQDKSPSWPRVSSAPTRLSTEPRIDHAQYIAHYMTMMRDNPRAIFKCAADAARAADYLFAFSEPAEQDGDEAIDTET